MKLKKKQLPGVALLIIGAAMIVYAIYAMNRISDAKRTISRITSPFSGSQEGHLVSDVLQGKASEHDTEVMLLMAGGLAVAAAGGYLFYRFRNK